jgi:hypothetical protein
VTGKLHRLRPATHDRNATALQLVLELPLRLRPETRADLTEALSSYHPEPWAYVMLSREMSRVILKRIMAGPRPGATLAVWEAARSYSVLGTGEIDATRDLLAEITGLPPGEVSRALARLARPDIGALVRTGRGRYALNPAAAWAGSLASREQAQTRTRPRPVPDPA